MEAIGPRITLQPGNTSGALKEKGNVMTYDPATRQFLVFDIGQSEPWKRN
jgi:hypothetical protein